MYLRRCYRRKDGKRHAYWALVESYRTNRGHRQRVVAWLGVMDERGRLGVKLCAEKRPGYQTGLFRTTEPEWVEVDIKRVRVERSRKFGGPWLGRELLRRLELDRFLEQTLPNGREEIPWSTMVMILILSRLCEPSSELHLAEHLYEASALSDLLSVPEEKVNEDRLYRALDILLPHKKELEKFLKEKLGELFDLDYDLLLYDITSTYFEGQAEANPQAQRGYSRDHRPDCKQVLIALVVTFDGFPLGYEVFAGNTHDARTLQTIVATMEARHGMLGRVWITDRGMASAENLAWLRQTGRRYIIGAPKSELKKFAAELMQPQGWRQIQEGVEVKLARHPETGETIVLCRSADRRSKEKAMHEKFSRRIESALERLAARIARSRKRLDRAQVNRQIGRILQQNQRAAARFEVVLEPDASAARYRLRRDCDAAFDDWAALSEGAYLLRSNIDDWSDRQLWKAYIQLTQAEAAFRIQKDQLNVRPIWHQRADRVQAHILVCFLAFVLWKCLEMWQSRAGLGNSPRTILEELARIQSHDVVLPTAAHGQIRLRCVTQPDPAQAVLLDRLGVVLPKRMRMPEQELISLPRSA